MWKEEFAEDGLRGMSLWRATIVVTVRVYRAGNFSRL
jgi:hypothetical protein